MGDTPFRVLVRNFLTGFFESDLLPDTVDARQALAGLVAVVLTPTLWLSLQPIAASNTHHMVWRQAIERGTTAQIYAEIELRYWGIELMFALYVMVVIAFVTLLVWDRLFPDRRDLMVLGTLPLSDRTLLGAKLAALVIVVGGFVLAISVPSAVGIAIGARNGPVSWTPLRYLCAHLIVIPAAGLFVFFSVTAVQTALGVFLRKRLLRALSVVLQLICVVVALEMFVFSVPLSRWLAENALRLTGESVGLWLPPFWFLGLYETIVGTEHAVFHETAPIAVLACGTSLAAVVVAYIASYRRVVRRVLESTEPLAGDPGWLTRLVNRLIYRVLVRHPTQQAVVAFVVRTLMRNQRYKLLLALYVGVGLSFIIGGLLFAFVDGRELLVATPTVLLLSMPLLLSFFALVGLRVLFTVPTELRANWIFRMSETHDKASYVRGIRTAMLGLALPPIVLATVPMYWLLWGPALAIGHTLFWLLLAALLAEVLLLRFHKVPFTCSYVPGKANVKLMGLVYLFALTTYAYTTTQLEVWLLGDPGRWAVGCACVLLSLVAIRLYRTRATPRSALTYEESAEPTVQVLHLMRPV